MPFQLPLSEELGQGSELRLLKVGRHTLHGFQLTSAAAGGDGAGLLTRSDRAVGLVAGGKGCKAESPLVDQIEVLKGVVADQGLRPFPRID